MGQILEIKVGIPLPEAIFEAAKLQGKIAEFAEQFQISLKAAEINHEMDMRVYTSKTRTKQPETKPRKTRQSRVPKDEVSQPERIVERGIPQTASGQPMPDGDAPTQPKRVSTTSFTDDMPEPPDFLKREKPKPGAVVPPWAGK